ncbi:hypothetical protein RDABS01_002408 [Bienertia sinuspersici]
MDNRLHSGKKMASLVRPTEKCAAKNLIIMTMMMTTMMMRVSSTSIVISNKNTHKSPQPKAWPEQFHSVLVQNNTKTSELQVINLWYDWINGRNLNLIQHQLRKLLYDVEYDNGTSYYFTLNGVKECKTLHFDVGILRPNWLDGATYLGQQHVDGFLCNVWEKVDFIWYYEDVLTQRPVQWIFYTGRVVHVVTFEVGAVLEDSKWQAPVYCFNKEEKKGHQTVARSVEDPQQLLRNSMPLSLAVV